MPAEDVEQLLLALSTHSVDLDKDLASACIRLTASCGMLADARQRIVAMVVARDPPMPPGPALLTSFLTACAKVGSRSP